MRSRECPDAWRDQAVDREREHDAAQMTQREKALELLELSDRAYTRAKEAGNYDQAGSFAESSVVYCRRIHLIDLQETEEKKGNIV